MTLERLLAGRRPVHTGTDHVEDLGGRPIVRIRGAIGSSIIAGLDRLVVCRPSRAGGPTDPAGCAVWSFGRVEAVRIGHYGSLAVVVLQLQDRGDGLPLLILEPGQGPAAIDGLATLQRLIDAVPLEPVTPSPISKPKTTPSPVPAAVGGRSFAHERTA